MAELEFHTGPPRPQSLPTAMRGQSLWTPTGSLFSPALRQLLLLLSFIHPTNTNLNHIPDPGVGVGDSWVN